MTLSTRLFSVALVTLAAITLSPAAWAQPGPGGPPPGPGGPGMPFGGPFMGAMFGSPYALLAADSVAKEVELTDDQKAKIKTINEKAQADTRAAFEDLRDLEPEERQKKMGDLREKMESQRKETNKAIEGVLLDHQVKRLKEIFIQIRGEQALRDPEVQESLGLSQDQKNKIRSILEILNDDQKAAFEKMKGDKFDVSTIRMGGPGGFGPGGRGPGGSGPGGERRRPPAAKSEQ
jgi:hypothetical protein